MARQPRELSESGYLHVMQRGIGQQLLFEEDADYRYYLEALERYSRETGVTVCAYCLMENHTHLLLYDTGDGIPKLMKKLGVRYVWYFNHKYARVGHLFQDRYRSETVEDDAYLLSVFRYILNNPLKAGICAAEDYPWSSYHCYGDRSSFVDTRCVEPFFGDREHYAGYIGQENDDACMDFSGGRRRDDHWALRVIRRELKGKSGTSLQGMDREERDKTLRKLKKAGLSIRQLERLTGINRGVIQKA